MSGETFSPRIKTYPAPTEALAGLPCRRFLFPRNRTLLAAVNDVLAYLARDYVWTGDEIDVLNARAAIALAMLNQQDCEDEDMPIGAITIIATATAPAGWLLCDGSTYNRVDYPALFVLIDPNYQLDADTFKTPDLRGLFVMGGGHGDYPLNSTGGAYTVSLTSETMPYHQHTLDPHHHTYQKADISDVDVAVGGGLASLVTLEADVTDNSEYLTDGGQGGSLPHNNTPPYLVLQYAIRAE